MRKSQLTRRLLLKGAGSVVVALPLCEELMGHKAWAADTTPDRLITMSFGLGIASDLQNEQWNGPLEPFKDLAPKMAMFSNLNNSSLRSKKTAHFEVGATQFTGVPQVGTSRAGGPSLEQIMRLKLHPNGVVPSATGLPSKSAGMWSRTGAVTQYVRHWNSNGNAGERPERRPSKVFDALFSNYDQQPNDTGNVEAEIEKRTRRSILDNVLEHYKSLTGVNSYLGTESKQRITAHLEAIRSIERELVEADLAADQIEAGEPVDVTLPQKSDYSDPSGIGFYDAASGQTTGPKVDWQSAQKAFRLCGDLFALGLSTDALRFGSMIFVGAGEHLRFTGTYNASNIGKSLNFSNTFNSRSPHDGIFHNYVKNSVRVYQHYVIGQLAYVLKKMDSIVEPNGKTVLDNTTVVIGTEYGRNHEHGGNIFHAVAGKNDKFKAGQYDGAHSFNDLYKTVLDAYGVQHNISGSRIDSMLV